MTRASAAQMAGDPLPFDDQVKTWPFWIAGTRHDGAARRWRRMTSIRSLKDTTHISVIDKDGNIFDSTPSGGWITGGVIAGNTGVGAVDARRAVLARQDSRGAAPSALAAALHADAKPRAARRRAVSRDRHAWRRQPGADDPAGAPQRRRVRRQVVSEPAHGVRAAASADVSTSSARSGRTAST